MKKLTKKQAEKIELDKLRIYIQDCLNYSSKSQQTLKPLKEFLSLVFSTFTIKSELLKMLNDAVKSNNKNSFNASLSNILIKIKELQK